MTKERTSGGGRSTTFVCLVIASNLASLVVTALAVVYAWKNEGIIPSSVADLSGAISNNFEQHTRAAQEVCCTCSDSLGMFKGVSGDAAFLDSSTPQYKAYQWMETEDKVEADSNEKTIQRYVVVTVFYSVSSDSAAVLLPEYIDLDECEWATATCGGTSTVTAINLANQQPMSLDGTIPGAEIGMLSALTSLDFSENILQGSIPEEIYALTSLTGLFLHNNQMTGTISNSIENLFSLERLMLNHNQLTGTMSRNFRSRQLIKPLRKSFTTMQCDAAVVMSVPTLIC
jgi:Leucine-rich repeat (LRR) protein